MLLEALLTGALIMGKYTLCSTCTNKNLSSVVGLYSTRARVPTFPQGLQPLILEFPTQSTAMRPSSPEDRCRSFKVNTVFLMPLRPSMRVY